MNNQIEPCSLNLVDPHRIEVEVLEGGKLPTKAHRSDAGFDVYAPRDFTIATNEIIRLPLAIKMALPPNTYAQMESRSGLGSKGMLLLAKIIDRNYRGQPTLVATNVGPGSLVFKKGDRVAQMIIHSHSENYYMVKVDSVSEDTDRGAGGFGNSGL